MSNILNIPSKNSYLTTKQWNEVVEYVKNRKNVAEEPEELVVEETVIGEVVEEQPRARMFAMKSTDSSTYANSRASIPSGYTEFTLSSMNSNGYLYSGKYCLTSDITLTKSLVIPQDNTVYLDLNGFVLSSPAINSLKNITHYNKDHQSLFARTIVVYGSLIINDSNPTKDNKGTIQTISRWIDKRLDSSKLTPEGTVYESLNTYTDRYFWDTTTTKEFWIYDKVGSDIIKGGIITGGIHTSGGGIYVGGGNLTINGGSIAGNKSIRYVDTAEGTGYQTGYTGNGGGIYATSYGTAGNSNYRESTVTMNGGSICYNWTDYLGGGVALNANTKFYMNSGDITENCAQGSGGGLTVRGGSSFYVGDENKTYNNDNVPVIKGNRTFSTRYHGGGGGMEVDGGNLEYKVGKIIENVASGSGGGIYCYRGGSVIASTSNSIISNNESSSGGGIFLQYGDVILDECIMENNISRSSGGAVGIRVGHFKMTNGIIRNNIAKTTGGAVHATAQNNFTPHNDVGNLSCSASIQGALVEGNQAGTHGGAFYISVMNSYGENSDVTVDIVSSTLKNNKAGTSQTGYGGVVYLSGGTLTVAEDVNYGNGKTEIYGNSASGGGVFYVEDRVRKSTDSPPPYIVTNPPDGAELDEAGMYWSKTLSTANITAYNDTKVGKIIIDSGSIRNNYATQSHGGVAYIVGRIKDNTQSYNVEINGGNFEDNNAVMHGGSVYVTGGSFVMTNGVFDGNTSEASGGAVYVADGNVDIDSGNIRDNIALDRGGAIAVTSGNVTMGTEECHDAGEFSTHSHPIIKGNIASDGGGIYVDGGVTTMWCGDIKQNLTYDKTVNVLVVSGGNFVYNGGTIGIPYDTGVFVNGGRFDDNSSESQKKLKHELHYHSVLDEKVHNGKIPESKWIASPRGDVLDSDEHNSFSPTWGDLFPQYEFVGWENKAETDTDEIVNLYAIWEEK